MCFVGDFVDTLGSVRVKKYTFTLKFLFLNLTIFDIESFEVSQTFIQRHKFKYFK